MKSKRNVMAFIAAILAAIMITGSIPASAASKRLQGNSRYETAVEISKAGWPGTSKIAVLAYGEDFPDALCAGPLASALSAPLLLTDTNTLDPSTQAELKRLNVQVVHIIGGEGVISSKVENQLKDMGIKTNRIKGENRYETSMQIAGYIHTVIHARAGEVFVVNGEDFADAVSVSPIAAKGGSPIILACPIDIPAYDEYIKEFIEYDMFDDAPAYIVGGSDVVRDKVADLFPEVIRIEGADGYERNAAVINYFEDRMDFTKPFIATGETFPDALAGSVLAAASPSEKTSPIILAGKPLSDSTKNLIKEKLSPESEITVLGGPGAVADSILSSIANIVQGLPDDQGGTTLAANTIQKIKDKWNLYKPTFSGNPFIEEPDVNGPYRAGRLKPEAIEDGVKMANFVRFLVGLPDDLVSDEGLNNQAQHGAVLCTANGMIDHYPPKPQDMDDNFYNIGYKSTSTSNLFSWMRGSPSNSIYNVNLIPGDMYTLSNSVKGYMADQGVVNAGHRRWIINPDLKKTGFGLAFEKEQKDGYYWLKGFSTMQVFDMSRSEEVNYDYIAWPNKGYFPVEFLEGDSAWQGGTSWSVSLNPDKYMEPQSSEVKVEIKRQSDNRTWVIDKSDNQDIKGQDYFLVDDGGVMPDGIIFRPGGVDSYNSGDIYDVTVTGIKDINGNNTVINYSVQFFNLE